MNWEIILTFLDNLFGYIDTYIESIFDSFIALFDIFITSLNTVLSALTANQFITMINLFVSKVPTIITAFIIVSFSFTVLVNILRRV